MKVLIALIAGVFGIAIGAAGLYFVSETDEPPKPKVATDNTIADQSDSDPLESTDDTVVEDLKRQLSDARKKVADLEDDKKNLNDDVATLTEKQTELADEVERLKGELDSAKNSVEPVDEHVMPIDFGKWNEVDGLRNADWKALGETYTKMHELMKAMAEDTAAGREPSQETQTKVGKLNQTLIDHLVAFYGKLPTHARGNGEFTHPVNMVNILSGQLEAADMPLTEQQITDLQSLGEQYDKKWEALQKGYDDNTYELQKIVDEAELKEWFRDEMFKVTMARQKAAALPPEIEGLLRFDLYSSGLMLMMHLQPQNVSNATDLTPRLKAHVGQLGVDTAALDSAEYIFDDWVGALHAQLQPKTEIEASMIKTRDVITAGKAQLAGMKALVDGVVVEESVKKNFRAVQSIIFPQVVLED